jgi:hypothetical protein
MGLVSSIEEEQRRIRALLLSHRRRTAASFSHGRGIAALYVERTWEFYLN